MTVKVGMTNGVGVDRMKITVEVNVGEGVSVLRGVGVKVGVCVEVGIAAAVCVEAALTVCAMKVLIAPGSGGGTGVASEGVHANITPTTINHRISLALYVNIFPLASEIETEDALKSIRFNLLFLYYFSTMIAA